MEHKSNPKTIHVIGLFMQNHLMNRGHRWEAPQIRLGQTRKDELVNLVWKLTSISKDLQDFIRDNFSETFEKCLKGTDLLDLSSIGYDEIEDLGGQLFGFGIAVGSRLNISTLITFLVYGAELAVKAMERALEIGSPDSGRKKVTKIVEWLSTYIDQYLVEVMDYYYSDYEHDGWFGIVYSYRPEKEETCKTTSTSQKVRYHHVGMAAIAVLVGGLYLCSRFPPQ